MRNTNVLPFKSLPLPFLGRKEEIESILRFHSLSTDSEGLSLMWLDGEAGIGKTALVSAAAAQVERNGGKVIKAGYYSGMPGSVAPGLADAVNSDPVLNKLNPVSLTAELPALLRGLRKIIRLRPTLLILEDVHLAGAREAIELQDLVRSLGQESTGIICTARPAPSPAHNALKPYLTHSIELGRLDRSAIRQLFDKLQLRASDADQERFLDSTKGHPLVLRSIWPELQRTSSSGRDHLAPTFLEELTRKEVADSVRELGTRILSPLNEEEKEAARRLATLGEIFSREAAGILLGDIRILESLEDHQIVREAPCVHRALAGADSKHRPLIFAHSLLHQQLLLEGSPPIQQLLQVVGSQTGIYSHLPLYLLTTGSAHIGEDCDLAECLTNLVRKLENLQMAVLRNPEQSSTFRELLEDILQHFKSSLTPEEYRRIRLLTYPFYCRMYYILSRSNEWQRTADRFLAETKDIQNETDIAFRIQALLHSTLCRDFLRSPIPLSFYEEVEQLAERYPALCTHLSFIQLVGHLCTSGVRIEAALLERARLLFDKLLAASDGTVANRDRLFQAGTNVARALARIAGTQEEVLELDRFNRTIQHELYNPKNPVSFRLFLFSRLMTDLYTDPMEAAALIRQHFYATAPGSFMRHIMLGKIIQIRLATGSPTDAIDADIEAFLEELQQVLPGQTGNTVPMDQTLLAQLLYHTALLTGQKDWGYSVAVQLSKDETLIDRILAPETAMLEGNIERARVYLEQGQTEVLCFRSCITCCAGDLSALQNAADELSGIFGIHPASSTALLQIRIAIRFAEEIAARSGDTGFLRTLQPHIRKALRNGITWCAEKNIAGFAAPLLELSRNYNTEREHRKLAAQINSLEDTSGVLSDLQQLFGKRPGDNRTILRLIGTIELQKPGEPEERILGPRIRQTAGLIAACHLMQTPLSNTEFRQIMTGLAPDSDKFNSSARTILWRVRSLLGTETIVSGTDDPPHFDEEHISVDILEIAHRLEQCEAAVRRDQSHKAREAIAEALTIVGEGPAYPSLYDDFFEAARLDFQFRLRETLLSVVDMLRRLEDYDEAIRILQLARTSLPADEMLTEQLTGIQELVRNRQHNTEM